MEGLLNLFLLDQIEDVENRLNEEINKKQIRDATVDLDLCSSNVQDAFVIAVEQQARERLERLSALKRVTPVDMTKLSQQVRFILFTTRVK
ncbi:hypothetical protein QE152_g15629 [Popillia japonica]|uniref:Uncharacterized protein n=1 Tax=Popillia japonica TaxID=7064 RepID=A0AAW1L7C8_POPJA